MALTVNTTAYDAQSLSDLLNNYFPEYKIKIQNKTTLLAVKGKIMTVVRIRQNKLTVHGDLYTKDPVILVLVILGILSGVIGVFIILGILYIIFAKAIKSQKNKVYSLLKENA